MSGDRRPLARAFGRARARLAVVPPELVAVLAVGAALRLHRLGAESLWYDETYSAAAVTDHGLRYLLGEHSTVDPHPPLYYVLLEVWTTLLGTSEVELRLLSAVLGVGAVGATYYLGRALFDRPASEAGGRDARVAAGVGALVVAVSPFHVWYAQEARMYTLLVLLAVLSSLALAQVAQSYSRRRAAGYVVVSALLCYTHVYGAFVVLAQAAFLAVAPALSDRGLALPFRRWLRLQAATAALAAPWLLVLLARVVGAGSGTAKITWIPDPSPVLLPFTGFVWTLGAGLIPGTPAIFTVPFVTVLPLAVLDPARVRRALRLERAAAEPTAQPRVGEDIETPHDDPHEDPSEDDAGSLVGTVPAGVVFLAALAVVPVVVPYVLSVLVTPFFVPRYTIPASVGFALLVGRGVASVPTGALKAVFVGLLVLSSAAPLVEYYAVDQKTQWDEATAFVERQVDADDAVLLAPRWDRMALGYYYDGPATMTPLANDAPPDRIREAAAGRDRVVLVLGPDADDDRFTGALAAEARGGGPAANATFYEVRVRVYEFGESESGA